VTGLLFVAVSINLDHILKVGRFLPAQATETLATVPCTIAGTSLAAEWAATLLTGADRPAGYRRRRLQRLGSTGRYRPQTGPYPAATARSSSSKSNSSSAVRSRADSCSP
jgi:hypothetical protein